MHLRTYPNTPLWFDMLLATGVIVLAHGLDEVIRPPRRAPRFEEVFPPEDRENQYHDEHLNLGKGAMGRRPSQEPHRLQQMRVEEAGRGRFARSPLTIPARGWKDIFWRTYTQIGDDRRAACRPRLRRLSWLRRLRSWWWVPRWRRLRRLPPWMRVPRLRRLPPRLRRLRLRQLWDRLWWLRRVGWLWRVRRRGGVLVAGPSPLVRLV